MLHHWNLGNRHDCRSVDKWTMKGMSPDGGGKIWPVTIHKETLTVYIIRGVYYTYVSSEQMEDQPIKIGCWVSKK